MRAGTRLEISTRRWASSMSRTCSIRSRTRAGNTRVGSDHHSPQEDLMPFKMPPPKRGKRRRVVLEFGSMTESALKRLAKAVKAVAKKHKMRVVRRKRKK